MSQFAEQEKALLHILEAIGTTNKFCVEFGARDGVCDSNTLVLRERGWECLLFDNVCHNETINLYKHSVTPQNINDLFARYDVPTELDFLSIDIDGMDYYVWEALEYQPRVVEIEANINLPPDVSLAIKPDNDFCWTPNSTYAGASPLALYNLGRRKGYKLVAMPACDMLFVRNDCDYPEKTLEQLFTKPFVLPGQRAPRDKWQNFEWQEV